MRCPSWITTASGAKRSAAVSSSLALIAWLQLSTTCGGIVGSSSPQPATATAKTAGAGERRRAAHRPATILAADGLLAHPEQRAIQALAREVADAEIAPHAAGWDRDHTFPRRALREARRARADGRLRARGARRRRRRLPLLHPRARGAVARRRGRRRHGRRAHERRRRCRSSRSAPTSSSGGSCPTLARGRGARRVRADRARLGLRRRRAAHDGRRRRRRLAARAARSSGSRTAATPARSSSSRAPTRRPTARAASARSCSTAPTSR